MHSKCAERLTHRPRTRPRCIEPRRYKQVTRPNIPGRAPSLSATPDNPLSGNPELLDAGPHGGAPQLVQRPVLDPAHTFLAQADDLAGSAQTAGGTAAQAKPQAQHLALAVGQ